MSAIATDIGSSMNIRHSARISELLPVSLGP